MDVHDPVAELFAAKPDAVRCPHRAHALLRSEAAPRWIDRIQAYAVTRYADIVEVLRAPEKFSSVMASGPGSVTPLARRLIESPEVGEDLRAKARRRVEISKSTVLLNADPPVHLRQRKLVNKAFTARRVMAMEPSVDKIAHNLISNFIGTGRAEMVADFSILLPMTVIADILGVPSELHATFKRWSDAFVAGAGSMALSDEEIGEIFDQVNEFYDYFSEQIERCQRDPTDDLLSAIVQARIDGETPLTHDEMLQMLVQFLVAGNETTTNLLTSIMFWLLTEPGLMAAVRADRALVPKVVEEVLRLEAPIQGLFRTATEDSEVGGITIPSGSNLFLAYAAGNRDDAVFAYPDTLKFDRSGDGTHLAFGKGEHFCLGAPIARLEARVGINAWLDRTSEIMLDCAPEDVEYQPSFALHGIKSLPLRFAA
ncbi:Cytochrome P450 [Haloechinothrix alba]|uniref:Cytochrome P450 n=1 Tax=Haloechinothrix alba TaxID=664784 RepID=A0A239A7F3_9PSEU|nr:cytochrome P450 [Haloechinothrix alba]SNR90813.1 Cytochrome P450 [Haloechinothrix alba]